MEYVQMMRKDRMNMIQTKVSFLDGRMLKLDVMDLFYVILVTTIAKREGRGNGVELHFQHYSVILWRSVLFVEETGIPGENHRLVTA